MDPTPVLILTKFGRKQYTHGLYLHVKFHLNPFIVSPHKKLTCGGLIYPISFIDECQIWSTFMWQISSQSVYSVALWWQNPQISRFFGLKHFVVSSSRPLTLYKES